MKIKPENHATGEGRPAGREGGTGNGTAPGPDADASGGGTPGRDRLKFVRHPYAKKFYAAYDASRVRVEQGGKWGEFTRDGVWLDGPLRSADPCFCRWVTSAFIYRRVRAGMEF